MAEALAIQDRFAAEPVYTKTGKGYLKSVGVSELQELKKQRKTDSNKTEQRPARPAGWNLLHGPLSWT